MTQQELDKFITWIKENHVITEDMTWTERHLLQEIEDLFCDYIMRKEGIV